jgi:hypothetical protein
MSDTRTAEAAEIAAPVSDDAEITVADSAVEDSATKEAAEETEAAEAPEGETDDSGAEPPKSRGKLFADKTWWLPWAIGAAVLIVGAAIIVNPFGGDDAPPQPQTPGDKLKAQLQTQQHTVIYDVRGTGKSPEIRYVSDGQNATEKVEKVDLPWHKEFSITVGPGPSIVQVMASNGGTPDGVACTVTVDGVAVNKNESPGQFSSVSCSGVVGVVAAPAK